MTVKEFRDTFYVNPGEMWALEINENTDGNFKYLATTTMSNQVIRSEVLSRDIKSWTIFTGRNYKKIAIQVK